MSRTETVIELSNNDGICERQGTKFAKNSITLSFGLSNPTGAPVDAPGEFLVGWRPPTGPMSTPHFIDADGLSELKSLGTEREEVLREVRDVERRILALDR